MMEIIITTILCTTFLLTVEMIRRYYVAKHDYEYKTRRLSHDDIVLAADGGEEDD